MFLYVLFIAQFSKKYALRFDKTYCFQIKLFSLNFMTLKISNFFFFRNCRLTFDEVCLKAPEGKARNTCIENRDASCKKFYGLFYDDWILDPASGEIHVFSTKSNFGN